MKVFLLALTGFGNTVLRALTGLNSVSVAGVFTVGHASPFPYYPETQLPEMCGTLGIPVHDGVSVNSRIGLRLLSAAQPDLIIVATFREILARAVLEQAHLGAVNLHPSLLPRYRGPCPTQAALLNGDTVTGVTAHYVTEGVDEGNIIAQESVTIDDDENDGALRRRLAGLAGTMVPDLIRRFAAGERPPGVAQVRGVSSPAPRPRLEDGYLERERDLDRMHRRVRAYTPNPGTSILVNGRRVAVERAEWVHDPQPEQQDGTYEVVSAVDVVVDGRVLRLHKAVCPPAR